MKKFCRVLLFLVLSFFVIQVYSTEIWADVLYLRGSGYGQITNCGRLTKNNSGNYTANDNLPQSDDFLSADSLWTFKHKGKARILLVEHVEKQDLQGFNIKISVYDPSDMTTPLSSNNNIFSNALIQSVSEYGNNLILSFGDSGNATQGAIIEVNPETCKIVGTPYTFGEEINLQAPGVYESLNAFTTVYKGKIYAMFEHYYVEELAINNKVVSVIRKMDTPGNVIASNEFPGYCFKISPVNDKLYFSIMNPDIDFGNDNISHREGGGLYRLSENLHTERIVEGDFTCFCSDGNDGLYFTSCDRSGNIVYMRYLYHWDGTESKMVYDVGGMTSNHNYMNIDDVGYDKDAGKLLLYVQTKDSGMPIGAKLVVLNPGRNGNLTVSQEFEGLWVVSIIDSSDDSDNDDDDELEFSTSIKTSGTVNQSYSGTITLTGGTAPYIWKKSGTLPTGLKLTYNSAKTKATLSGTPTEAGKFTFTLKVTDANGNTASKSFTINIAAAATKPTLSGTVSDGIIKAAYTKKTFKVTGGTSPYTWKKTGTLPTGLKLTYNSAKTQAYLSGTPTKAGTFDFTLKVTDANNKSASKSFTITITKPTMSGTVSNGIIKAAYAKKTFKVTGGTAPYTWTKSGTLPNGLKLTYNSAKTQAYLSGTPTKAGDFTFKLTAKDSNGASVSKSFTVTITKPTMSGTVSDGTVGTAYSKKTFTVTGGTAPYTWKKTGTLPTGLTLTYNSTKTKAYLSGTPTKAGIFDFTLKATDTNGAAVSKSFTITIKTSKPTLSGSVSDGVVGTAYTKATFTVSGGTAPYTWKKSGLPSGLKFTTSGAKATLSGTPTKAGTFSFKVTVTDANGASVSKSFTIKITAATAKLKISGTFDDGEIYESYTSSIKVSGGTSFYKWVQSSGMLPPGLEIEPNSTGTTLKLTGIPLKIGTFTFTLLVEDANGLSLSKKFTVTIYDDEDDEYDDDDDYFDIAGLESKSSQTDDVKQGFVLPKTELKILSEDIFWQGEGKDEDLFEVKAEQPVTFIIGEWIGNNGTTIKISALDINVYVDDKLVEDITISDEGVFTLPSEFVCDDFKVQAKANIEGFELETEELFISAVK